MTTPRTFKLEKQESTMMTKESAQNISFCHVSCAYAGHVERAFGQVRYGRFEEVDTRRSPGMRVGALHEAPTVVGRTELGAP